MKFVLNLLCLFIFEVKNVVKATLSFNFTGLCVAIFKQKNQKSNINQIKSYKDMNTFSELKKSLKLR